jgi:NodT family efflux transporter outer membrane factor (OMF) lipoprotein
MMKRTLQRTGGIFFSGALVLMLGGCVHNVVPSSELVKETRKLGTQPPKRFQSSYTGGKVRDGWLRSFRDPTLNRLVAEAQRNNPDIQLAAARVEKAAALMNLTASGLYPTLGVSGTHYQRNYTYKNGDHYKTTGVFTIGWEPDIWGRVSNLTVADAELTVAQLADYEWARQSLSATTAKAWFLLGADKMIADFARQVVTIQKKAEEVLQKRAKIGQGNMRDVHMIRGMLAEAQDTLQSALAAKDRDTRALETLIGRYPGNRIKAYALRGVTGRVPTGVPLGLLNRRPDIIAAQYRVASAFHKTEAAKLLRLPTLDLSLQLGYETLEERLAKLFAGLFMPLFDGGNIQAQIDAATADQKAAIAAYRKAVLNAYREVETALSRERYLARRYAYLNTMVREYKTAYEMTDKNYKIGQGTILDVLQAQSKWINARILRTQVMKERLVNRVNLHLALGGSFK